jgi:L-idonate 5-dehydrogenase
MSTTEKTMTAAILHGARDIRIERKPLPETSPGMVLLRVLRAGICGSDLHYFGHGYCASFVPSRPFVLGHEFTAVVEKTGEGVNSVNPGDRVTANPARSCGFCERCKEGRPNLCSGIIMLGSASTTPPTDGAFAGFVVVRADQCHRLPGGMDESLGAMIEPLAVALHAVRRSGDVSGKRILVTGGGPIGLLAALVARAFGAVPVALSDIVASRRETALRIGVDAVVDPSSDKAVEQFGEIARDGFDVVLEASGARSALRQSFDLVRPGGTIVQIGTLGSEDIPLPANLLMNREINLIGSMRYGNVFGEAIRLVSSGRIDLRPLVNDVLPLAEISRAMDLAADKNQALKVQLTIP